MKQFVCLGIFVALLTTAMVSTVNTSQNEPKLTAWVERSDADGKFHVYVQSDLPVKEYNIKGINGCAFSQLNYQGNEIDVGSHEQFIETFGSNVTVIVKAENNRCASIVINDLHSLKWIDH